MSYVGDSKTETMTDLSRRCFRWRLRGGFSRSLWECGGRTFDTIPLSRTAKIVREGTVLVPARETGTAGLAGADVSSPARAG